MKRLKWSLEYYLREENDGVWLIRLLDPSNMSLMDHAAEAVRIVGEICLQPVQALPKYRHVSFLVRRILDALPADRNRRSDCKQRLARQVDILLSSPREISAGTRENLGVLARELPAPQQTVADVEGEGGEETFRSLGVSVSGEFRRRTH